MDELDFSKGFAKPKPAPQKPEPPVNLAAALDFFRTAGVAENIDTGTNIFVEDEKAGLFSFGKSRKMYLLLEGEVNLIAANKLIGVVRSGEIFGEMAAISDSPRAATAVAKTPCRLISMDDKGFHSALRAKPDFALTLLGMMINRLRAMLARKDAAGLSEAKKESRVFDKGLLAALAKGLGPTNAAKVEKGKTIMTEGQAGAMMYVVLEGRVAVSIQGKVVERVGPGGAFGEMALIDQSPRAASAVAEVESVLLTLNRAVFLQLVKTQPEFGVALLTAAAERVRFMASR